MDNTPNPLSYLPILHEQVERVGLIAKFVLVGAPPQILSHMRKLAEDVEKQIEILESDLYPDETVDFVFLLNPTDKLLEQWYDRIRPGGLLAGLFPEDRGMIERFAVAVNHGFYGDGSADNAGYSCFGIPKQISQPVHIFLGLPNYDGTAFAQGLMRACSYAYSGLGVTRCQENHISLLAGNFNQLWCAALNDPTVTHFAMLHADILPSIYWLDILMHELENTGSHMVSTVVPIKDGCGVTSTGIAYRGMDNWCPYKRFTMSEIMNMPATFDAEMAGFPGRQLILNTGCWMADLRDDRWKMMDENDELIAKFTIQDRITKDEDGNLVSWVLPEDFNFSILAQRLGFRVMATRKVQVQHMGKQAFPNDRPWGNWKVDELTRDFWAKPEVDLDTVGV